MMVRQLQVAVGIIRNSHNEIFITRRQDDVHMAGKWEFPGGKVEAGEFPQHALFRELKEETGISVLCCTLFKRLEHSYPDRHITLWFYLVEQWEGVPWGKEGQPGQWIAQHTLRAEDFPPANKEVINALRLL